MKIENSFNVYPITNGAEEIILDDSGLRVKVGENFLYAMHEAETDLSKCMASLTTRNGGDILEIGFGVGASADEIQKNSNVASHTIIELNKNVYEKALEWAKDKKNTEILLGDWIDVLPTLDKKFDGILHDTWFDNNIVLFPEMCKQVSKLNAILVFFYFPHGNLEQFNEQNEQLFNVKEYQFSEEEYHRLPESYTYYYDFFYNNRIYNDIRYTMFNGSDFVKPYFKV